MKKQFMLKLRRGKLVEGILKFIFKMFSLLPVKKNSIVFESFLGKQYSDNPKAIYDYIREHHPSYETYWSLSGDNFKQLNDKFNDEAVFLRRFTFQWLYTMARAEYWVTNSRFPLWYPKRKETTYLQTWHGTPLKKLATDMAEVYMPGTTTDVYKRNFVYEAKKWDYLISPNNYSTEIFKRAFQYEGEIVESGYPRNDILINGNQPKNILELKQKMNLPLDKKIILYAPTWRDNKYHSIGKYKLEIQLDLKEMQNRLGEEYIVILRLHYLIAQHIDISNFKEFVYDFSVYQDIAELYLVSDVLITDYSSVFFDYAILKRPILFFVYDLEEYRDELRGFYFDFENEAPGPLVRTTEQLIEEIVKIEKGDFPTNNQDDFFKKFCYLEDGNATKRIVNLLFEQ